MQVQEIVTKIINNDNISNKPPKSLELRIVKPNNSITLVEDSTTLASSVASTNGSKIRQMQLNVVDAKTAKILNKEDSNATKEDSNATTAVINSRVTRPTRYTEADRKEATRISQIKYWNKPFLEDQELLKQDVEKLQQEIIITNRRIDKVLEFLEYYQELFEIVNNNQRRR